jgi:predicted DNA-binding transcriptional regulator AlpA
MGSVPKMNASTKHAAAFGKNEAHTATAQADRLLTFREVHALTGSACKTGHYARALAARGQIKAVRLNERVVRYTESSVRALVGGNAAA